MSNASSTDTDSAGAAGGANLSPGSGASPDATGGAGVTFERKVAVQYLVCLLTGNTATEIGHSRRVDCVAFQQAPEHAVDDLVIHAVHPNGLEPPLVLALGVRRSPRIVRTDESSQKLILQFVRAAIKEPSDGNEYQFGIVVSGSPTHAMQLARLADLAVAQMDAAGFFGLVQTPGKFLSGLRRRLKHLSTLVDRSLRHLGTPNPDAGTVQQHTWQLLSRLKVVMPRLESPDESDWTAVVNSLRPVARDTDLDVASSLRDHLLVLAGAYAAKAARVDLTIIRRDSHTFLDDTTRLYERGWQTLRRIDRFARDAVRGEIIGHDDRHSIHLERNDAAGALANMVSKTEAVIVSGESGVGKSALAVIGLTSKASAEQDRFQAVCINLRQVPKLSIELEETLGRPLSTILSELSAPQRVLVIDGADAVTEDKHEVFRYLVGTARDSGIKVVAVTSIANKQVVLETLHDRLRTTDIGDYVVPSLSDPEIDEVVDTFPELQRLSANSRSRELLRRLVVVQLLVRGQFSGTPLTDADAMNEVWSGLVRRRGVSDRGSPDARETALLRLAELELGKGERLDVLSSLDSVAMDGLRRDGLLRDSTEDPFSIGPQFGHDEVRRYAVARLLLVSGDPATRLLQAAAPRWSLPAARLACQAWLAQPDTPAMPVKGRFIEQQKSFDKLANGGHGVRWADVPSEALLTLADPSVLLRDAWPEFLTNDAYGLRRLVRLVDQRLRDDRGIVDIVSAEPIVELLLEDPTPWQRGEHVTRLIRAWLHAHVLAGTGSGTPSRVLLHDRLVEACRVADQRLAKEWDAFAAVQAARTPEEVDRDRQILLPIDFGYTRNHRQRPAVPREIKNRSVLEFLGLLGPDLGSQGEAVLRRVARDAPEWLAPAVEEPLTGQALAKARQGLLAELTEAYYLDDEVELDRFTSHETGVRRHDSRTLGAIPLTAFYRGPFMPLFQTDFSNGVAVLNRLLNHATRFRVRTLARLDRTPTQLDSRTVGPYGKELDVTGVRRVYMGDDHVWRWYRGTGVGPHPCVSALSALERVCDQLIAGDVPINALIPILLNGCESVAMVGLIVAILVRHLEVADRLLDPYLTEPSIWQLEFARMVSETSPFAASSDGLVAPERRKWSLREASALMVVRAQDPRSAELRKLGEELVDKARRLAQQEYDQPVGPDASNVASEHPLVVQARAWASSLDRDRFQVEETAEGLVVQATPPVDVVDALKSRNEDLERDSESIRLFVRYHVRRTNETAPETIGRDDLVADIGVARKLLEDSPSRSPHDPWDTAALVSAVALEADLLKAADLPEDALAVATEIILRVGDATPRQDEFEGTFREYGADRSAARIMPLFLLPVGAKLRDLPEEKDGLTTLERAARGAVNLARTSSEEVRLHLARGLDQVWSVPCADEHCHHEIGWQIATEMMRYCALGPWNPQSGRRNVVALEEPLIESLAGTEGDSIVVSRLDGAIRALAPAAVAGICVSARARQLLLVLLAAQRRALLDCERGDLDGSESHTLVSARALLTLAQDDDDTPILAHLTAYADNSTLLGKTLRSLSAAAEETRERAETAKRIWPSVLRHVLDLHASGHKTFQDRYYGDMTLAALIPNPGGDSQYLYREIEHRPIVWWNPFELRLEVEAWLAPASGVAMCVDQLIGFIQALAPSDQLRIGLPWLATLALADPRAVAGGSYTLATWLIQTRPLAVDTALMPTWQEVVDTLVVAGDSRLAPYSD